MGGRPRSRSAPGRPECPAGVRSVTVCPTSLERFQNSFGIVPDPSYTGRVNESEATTALRGASLRVTQPRVAVLTVIHDAPHVDTATVVALVRERLGNVSTQAVYDVLKVLVDAGIARRIDLPGSPARYELAHDDHQHAVCRGCGSITDMAAPADLGADHHGFAVDSVAVTYWGLCPECQQTHHVPDRPPVSRSPNEGAA